MTFTKLLASLLIASIPLCGYSNQYKVVNLGSDISGSFVSTGVDINDVGEVIGTYTTSEFGNPYGFVWSQSLGMRTLSSPGSGWDTRPVSISNSGQIVGSSSSVYPSAKLSWNRENQHTLITHQSLDPHWYVHGVNSGGVILGSKVGAASEGIIFGGGINYTELGTLPGATSEFRPDSINDLNQVAGNSLVDGKSVAVLYDPIAGLRSLGSLGGRTAASTDINNATQVVGRSSNAQGIVRGFFWDSEAGIISTGALSNGASNALGISNSGEVVGWSDTVTSRVGTVWSKQSGLRDLNTMLIENPDNFRITSASAVNSQGWIVASGYAPGSGIETALLLQPVPVPEPTSIIAFGSGILVLLRRKRS